MNVLASALAQAVRYRFERRLSKGFPMIPHSETVARRKSSGTILIKNAELVVTMDSARREIPGGAVYAEDGLIRYSGETTACNCSTCRLDLKFRAIAGEQVANFSVDGFLRPDDEAAPMVFGLLPEDLDHVQFGTIKKLSQLESAGRDDQEDHWY